MMNAPVFVFSAGWRSGSTLLQRMITASGEVLIWGEAGGALDCLADAWARYEQMLGPGNIRYRHGFGGNGTEEFQNFVSAGDERADQWIACMNPRAEHIRETLVRALDELYGRPSRQYGYRRWGVKEVRSGINTATFLSGLFPNAKFVFLVRHPLACLESIKRRGWVDAGETEDPLATFALHWVTLASQFRSADFGLRLKFEELTTDSGVLPQLAKYLELERIPAQFPSRSRADWEPISQRGLNWRERRRLVRIVGQEMRRWGYEPRMGEQ